MQDGSATDREEIADDASAPVNYTEWYRECFGDSDVWLLAAGPGGVLWDDFKESSIATVGWADIGDLRDYYDESWWVIYRRVLAALIKTGEFETMPKNIANGLTCFLRSMGVGDTIIARRGTTSILGIGKVRGEYTYDASRQGHRHKRTVEWTSFERPVIIPDKHRGVPTKTLTEYTSKKKWLYDIWGILPDPGEVGPEEYPPYTPSQALRDLFIREKHFHRILNALESRKNLILQGPPGTGKTFMARRLAWCLIGSQDSRSIEMVQFHQSYAYEDFVQGYRPTESGGFTLRNGVFYEFCECARKDPDTPYIFIIDEINRGNMSRIFGELLMLIEADKRTQQYATSLTYDNNPFFVPLNVYILGLMNTADRSLAIVDYALRRRFAFENLEPSFGNRNFWKHLLKSNVDKDTVRLIRDRMSAVNTQISEDAELGRGFEIGHSYFVSGGPEKIGDDARDWYADIVETQIAPLLREYWFDNPGKAKQAIKELRE